jgi:tripartite-type tricarboxylate transporter receptor subunit TctC
MRTRFAAVFVAALFLLTPFISTGVFAASDYPNRAITIIVPFPAGGVTDLAARTVADAMEKHLKQPVVVINKVGGGTTIGGYAVASAKPDGYTLGYFPMATSLPEAFEYFQDAPYTSKDLRPVSGVIEVVMAAAVKEDAPWNSFKELIEYARKNPGLKIGTGGKQTLQHMFLSILNRTEKTGFVGVPFAGDPQNLAAVLGGHTSVFFGDYSAVSAVAGAKKVKVLAVVAEKRPDFAPHVPTVGELGYPCKFVSILGLVGPRGLPNEMVTKIETLVGTICTEPDFQMKIRNATMQIHYKNAAAYQSHLATYKEYVVEFFKEEGLVKK